MARGASSGNALAHVLVMPASSSLPGDGETRTGVTIVTVDRDGHPVGGVPVGLQVEGADGCSGSRVLPIRGDHRDIAVVEHGSGEHVETLGIDAVVVGHHDPRHGPDPTGALGARRRREVGRR